MDYTSSAQFVSSLVKSLHSLCNNYMEFDTWVQINGTLLMHTDMGKSIEFVIDEKVYKPTKINALSFQMEKQKQGQETWDFTPVVEQLVEQPQGNIHDLVNAARQTEPNFELAYTEVEDDNLIYTSSQEQFMKVDQTVSAIIEHAADIEIKEEKPDVGIQRRMKRPMNSFPIGQGPHKCNICGKGFTRDSTLKVHKRLHTGERPYKCEVCQRRFNTSQDLRVHSRTHSGEKPYKCRICGEGFAQYGTVQRHERTHPEISAIVEKTHICEVCNRAFDRRDALNRHRKVHEENKIIKCKICQQVFEDKMSLALHVHKHKKKKLKIDLATAALKMEHICVDCGKSFDMESKLRNHQKIHEEERKNACKICKEEFPSKMELIIHKSKHCKPSGKPATWASGKNIFSENVENIAQKQITQTVNNQQNIETVDNQQSIETVDNQQSIEIMDNQQNIQTVDNQQSIETMDNQQNIQDVS